MEVQWLTIRSGVTEQPTFLAWHTSNGSPDGAVRQPEPKNEQFERIDTSTSLCSVPGRPRPRPDRPQSGRPRRFHRRHDTSARWAGASRCNCPDRRHQADDHQRRGGSLSGPSGPIMLIRLPQRRSSACSRSATFWVSVRTSTPEPGYPISAATDWTTESLLAGGQQL